MPNRINQNNLAIWLRNPRNLVIVGLAVIAIVALAFFFFSNKDASSENNPSVRINKSYEVTARTKDRKATDGKLKVVVTNAQIANSVLVQGKVARPVKGKVFLVVNMEIENPYKVALYSFPVDLFRFVRSDDQKFAPSVHQGTVEIRPQATKKSNAAFVVDPKDKRFKIEVGEVGKEKQTLEITFR